MPIPFLSSIGLNKNEVQDFKVFNLASDPTLTSGGDFGYFWLNTSGTKTLKFWDGANIRSLIDSTTISSSTAGSANDLTGGLAGSLPYQQGAGDTTFLGIGTADQVLTVNSGATAPQWLSQSSLSVGSATNKTGGNLGDLLVQTGSGTTSFLSAGTAGQVITSNGASPQYVNQSTLSVGSATTATTATNVAGGANGSILVQSGAGTTGQLAIGASGYILTSNGTTPGWSASIPSTSVSGLAASATTDTTNASNISSGTLGLARLALATGQFYVGDGSNNPAATAKSSIPLSGFGAAGADVAMGGFKITGLADPAAATDAATRGYVDSVAQGLDVKASCLVATTADITLASPGAVTIDGIYSATDFTAGTTRILVKDQSAPAENGIYIWQGPAAAMTRSADANTWDELVGAFTFVERGTANADSGWVCSVNAGGTLGSTAVTFVKFSQAGSYTAGNGIVQSGTSFNFAQSAAYTAGQIPFASSTTAMGFSANLHWDNANNRLGIGTATPRFTLDATGDIAIPLNSKVYAYYATATNYASFGANNSGNIEFTTGTSSPAVRQTIAADGVCTWSNVGGVAGTAMILNGTGLGVGAVPSGYQLQIENASADCLARFKSGTANVGLALDYSNSYGFSVLRKAGSDKWLYGVINESSSTPGFRLQAGDGSVPFYVQYGGNVGIGTATPLLKFVVSNAGAQGFEINPNSGGGSGSYAGGIDILCFNRTTSAYKPFASFAESFAWLTATTGSPSEKMVLTTDGNLGLGVTPANWSSLIGPVLQINNGSFYAYSNEIRINANFKYDGADKYISNGYATSYNQASGAHYWYSAANNTSGANAALTWGGAKMSLDASGNLGLGVTPNSTIFSGDETRLVVKGNANYYAGTIAVQSKGTVNAVTGFLTATDGSNAVHVGALTNSNLIFYTNGTSKATLDASGNLGVGTANPSTYGKLAVLSGATATTAFFDTTAATAYSSTSYFAGPNITIRTAANATGNGSGIRFASSSNGSLEGFFGWVQNASGYGDFVFQGYNGAYTERLRIKSTGQVNFVGQASDPAGAAGDVVYNSTSNRLKYHNGTAWVDSGTRKVSVVGGAGTGTYIDATHNFNTKTVSVTVLRTTDNVVVYTDVAMTNDNTVRVTFASSVTLADYTVTVIG